MSIITRKGATQKYGNIPSASEKNDANENNIAK